MSGSKAVRGGALATMLTMLACSIFGSFHLSASSLDVGPDPAAPGDTVMASFIVRVAPAQPYTVILTVNGAEHLRVTSTEAPPLISVVTLGDAATLIAQYGVGTHSARVEVRADEDNRSARTQSVGFELRDSIP